MNQTPVSLNFSAHGTASGTPWRAVAGRSRVAVICASWHTDVVHQARDSMAAELQAQGVAAQNISHFNVPGAFEIPLLAKKLADTGRFDAIIACALVVNGGIYRHEFVSSAVIDGRSEEHTSELQSHSDLVCRLLLEKKKEATCECVARGADRCLVMQLRRRVVRTSRQ